MPLPASRRKMCAGQLGPQHKTTIAGDARRVMAADEATLASLVLHCAGVCCCCTPTYRLHANIRMLLG
jgi:hypothetical protein